MTFQQLISRNEWLSVEFELVKLYPGEKESIFLYKDIYLQLRMMESSPSEMMIELENCFDEGNGDFYIDVRGTKLSDNSSVQVSYALEFTAWNEWLEMEIATDTLAKFTELEIIAHCLYEMTFISFDPEEIQEKYNQIRRDVAELTSSSEEEQMEEWTSWEEIKKELGIYSEREE